MADDLIDVLSDDISSGKSVGQDEKNNRPNASVNLELKERSDIFKIFWRGYFFYTFMPWRRELAQLVKMQAAKMLEINDSKIIV